MRIASAVTPYTPGSRAPSAFGRPAAERCVYITSPRARSSPVYVPCPPHQGERAEQASSRRPPVTGFRRWVAAPIASASCRAVIGPRSHSTFRICTARTGRSAGQPIRSANRRCPTARRPPARTPSVSRCPSTARRRASRSGTVGRPRVCRRSDFTW